MIRGSRNPECPRLPTPWSKVGTMPMLLPFLVACVALVGCQRPATLSKGSEGEGTGAGTHPAEPTGQGHPPIPFSSAKELPPRVHVQDAILSPDGKLAMTRYVMTQGRHFPPSFKPWRLWDASTGKELRAFDDGDLNWFAFLPDGRRALAKKRDEPFQVWDPAQGKLLRALDDSARDAQYMDLSPDAKVIAVTGVGGPGGLQLLDSKSGKLLRALADGGCFRALFTQDGKQVYGLAQYSKGPMPWGVWDVATGQLLREGIREDAWKFPLAFSPDGRWAVSNRWDGNYDHKARLVLWEVPTGKVVRTFEPRQGGLPPNLAWYGALAAAFSPDGQYVVTDDDDGLLRRWQVATGKVVQSAEGSARVCAFTPDGRWLFTANGEDWGPGGGEAEIWLRLWNTATLTVLRKFDQPGER